jgi:hypothetical protein
MWQRLMPLFVLVMAINLLAMPGTIGIGDSTVAREETRSFIRSGTLHVDPEMAKALGPGMSFDYNPRNNRWYSKYGIAYSMSFLPPLLMEKIMRQGTTPFELRVLNIYFVLVSLIVAALLARLALRYTRRALPIAIFVLTSFYATFLWNFLRIQTIELFQLLYFLGYYICLLEYAERGRSRSLCGSGAFFLLLSMTRPSFLALAAPLGLAGIYRRRWLEPAAVVLAALAVIGLANFIKFGSPLLSGYHQWWDPGVPVIGSWREGLHGFFFDPRKSIWTHYPVFAFALLGYGIWWRRHRLDLVLSQGLFWMSVLVIGKLGIWSGDDCYGPRYLLFALPVAALPLVSVLDEWCAKPLALRTGALAALFALSCGYSTFLQLRVNRLDFYAYFNIRNVLRTNGLGTEYRDYIVKRHQGRVDWNRVKADVFLSGTDRRRAREVVERITKELSFSNYYFF